MAGELMTAINTKYGGSTASAKTPSLARYITKDAATGKNSVTGDNKVNMLEDATGAGAGSMIGGAISAWGDSMESETFNDTSRASDKANAYSGLKKTELVHKSTAGSDALQGFGAGAALTADASLSPQALAASGGLSALIPVATGLAGMTASMVNGKNERAIKGASLRDSQNYNSSINNYSGIDNSQQQVTGIQARYGYKNNSNKTKIVEAESSSKNPEVIKRSDGSVDPVPGNVSHEEGGVDVALNPGDEVVPANNPTEPLTEKEIIANIVKRYRHG